MYSKRAYIDDLAPGIQAQGEATVKASTRAIEFLKTTELFKGNSVVFKPKSILQARFGETRDEYSEIRSLGVGIL